MRNKIILLVFAFFLGLLCFNKFVLQIVWVNPNVNTRVFPYITKSMKELDKALHHSIMAVKAEKSDARIMYENAYGSGFLKMNTIPNDLDYSVGIYLGEYEYNGENAKEIAKQIENVMTAFQIAFYNYINEFVPDKFYADYNTFQSIQKFSYNKKNNIESITKSLPEIFNKKDYVLYTTKMIQHEHSTEETPMMFPFILKKNEILIEDYSPITLFSKIVEYSNETRPILREITIVTDFYADIKQGKDTIHAEIVAESFKGQRLQLSRRFFVPVVFVGNNSANFLKHFEPLNNNDTYIEYRMFNFRRHIQEISNLTNMQERPIKLLKRILQATDLIAPALDEKTLSEITDTVGGLLENPQIKLINDYETAYSNLLQIVGNPNIYNQTGKDNLNKHIQEMYNIIEEMKATNKFDEKNISELTRFTNDLNLDKIKSEEDIKAYYDKALIQAQPASYMLDTIVMQIIPKEVYQYSDKFLDIIQKAGYHQINICWLDKNLIGVVKDDFTSKIPANKLKEMAVQNNLVNAEYKFIKPSELSGPKVRYMVWVRYNSSNEENQEWENIKSKLIADKDNFNIKRRLAIPTTYVQKLLTSHKK